MKWYCPSQASLERLEDQLPVLVITDAHEVLVDDAEAASHKIMLPRVTVRAVLSVGEALSGWRADGRGGSLSGMTTSPNPYRASARTLRHPEVLKRYTSIEGVMTFDLVKDGRE
jgi:hypothetical protein